MGRQGLAGDGGPGAEAMLHLPGGVATDAAGNVYFADRFNHRIRRVDASGIISTIAGSGGSGRHEEGGFSGDGGPAVEARLHSPIGVAVDSAGNLYIADSENHRIRVLAQTPATPTHLTARAVSLQEIDLTWQDNSVNETGFRVQRRWEGSADWLEIGTVTANTTTLSDSGLEPATTYLYRVQAFNSIVASAFSNEASGDDSKIAAAGRDPVLPRPEGWSAHVSRSRGPTFSALLPYYSTESAPSSSRSSRQRASKPWCRREPPAVRSAWSLQGEEA